MFASRYGPTILALLGLARIAAGCAAAGAAGGVVHETAPAVETSAPEPGAREHRMRIERILRGEDLDDIARNNDSNRWW